LLALLAVALGRVAYPFEVEWLEGAALDEVRHAGAGGALYAAPSLSYVPLNYTPLYFWVASLFAHVFRPTFLALRMVSLLSALAVIGFLVDLVRRETRSWTAAFISAGLFAATFRLGGAWLDLAHVDSLSLALLFAGVWTLRVEPSPPRSGVVAGALFVASCLA